MDLFSITLDAICCFIAIAVFNLSVNLIEIPDLAIVTSCTFVINVKLLYSTCYGIL